jgi:hypothetical protein
MKYLTDEEINSLKRCVTVWDMLNFLNDKFDLSLVPTFLEKTLLVNGLVKAMDSLKPVRKNSHRKRIFKHETKSANTTGTVRT